MNPLTKDIRAQQVASHSAQPTQFIASEAILAGQEISVSPPPAASPRPVPPVNIPGASSGAFESNPTGGLKPQGLKSALAPNELPPRTDTGEHLSHPGTGATAHISTSSGKVRSDGNINLVSGMPEEEISRRTNPEGTGTASAASFSSITGVASRGENELILVIDDDASICRVLRAMLETHGYQSLFAQDGRAGLNTYREQRDKISVVITDMTMQGMQGPEVIRELRLMNPDVRIVAISGFFSKCIDITEVTGRLVFLPKPMSLRELKEALERVMPVKSE